MRSKHYFASLPVSEHAAQLRRAMIAGTVGTTIVWYGFELYGTMTALAFSKLFFPHSSSMANVLEAFGVFFVGFVGRPLGAAIFGHWGDRIGRKSALTVTLLITGVSTMLVGCLPTYDSIGIWAPALLTLLRLAQGIGVGGEWGGSVLITIEWARTDKERGFLSAWPQFASPAGLFLANCAVLVFSWVSGDQFLLWGWRIPFLLSAAMAAVGLWARLGLVETPVFRRIQDERRIERVPGWQVLRRQPRQLLLTALLRLPEQAPGYIVGAWVVSYGTSVLGLSGNFLLAGLITQTLLAAIWVVVAGYFSDIFGRRKVFIVGCISMGLFGFIYVPMLNSGVTWIIFLAIAISLLPAMTQYGPQAALIAESFTPRLRYSGSSLGYQLASIIAGGPSPMIATWLFVTFKSLWSIAIYIAVCSCIGIIAAALLPDYTNKSITTEYPGV